MPGRSALLAGAAALLAFFLWRRNARAAPFVPTGPSPQPVPTGPVEEPIPPMSEEEADRVFQQAQASSYFPELISITETFFENGFDQYGRAIENAMNWYGQGTQCNRLTCIDSQIVPNLNRLAQTGFMGLFGQLSVHHSLVIANAQERGEV